MNEILDKQPPIQTTKSGHKIPAFGQPNRVADSNSRSKLKAPPKPSIEVSHLDPNTFLKFSELPRDLSFIIFDEHIRERKSRTIVIYYAKRSQRTPVNEQDGNYTSPASAKYLPLSPAETNGEFDSTLKTPSLVWPWELRTAKCSIPAALLVNRKFC